jgi:predicted transcriptional regulator
MAASRKNQDFEVIGVRVASDLRRKLEDIAKNEERTISQVARIAIREFVERKNEAAA